MLTNKDFAFVVARLIIAPMKTKPSRAFTLVETIMAIGIVSFAMLPILGLMPVGLSNLRDAISLTAESQIVQALSNDILLTDYQKVVGRFGGDPEVRYYDDAGGQLAGASSPGRVFTVSVSLRDVSVPVDASVTPVASKCALIAITNVKFPLAGKKYSLVIPRT
jgi:uncharacterized protein (TIGR02598 family)